MMLHWMVATVHLLALGIGLGAVWARAQALRGSLSRDDLRRVLTADTWWGIAAALWLVTGLWRAFGGLEKGTAYYLAQPLFHAKITLFLVVFGLEIAPMLAFIKWRRQLGRGGTPDTSKAPRYATISVVEAVLVVLIVACAVGMARGYLL
jgi:putative membrane protein